MVVLICAHSRFSHFFSLTRNKSLLLISTRFCLNYGLPYARQERLTKWNKILTSEKHDSIKIKYTLALVIAGEVESKTSPIEM